MIPLTRLNGGALYLNAELIATIEEHHDTVVTLMDGKCLVVAETAAEVVAEIVSHRAAILAMAERLLAIPAVHESSESSARILTLRPGTGT